MSPAARREALRLLLLTGRATAVRTVWAAVAVFAALFGVAASVGWRVTTRLLRKREARRTARRAAALALLLLPHRHRAGRHRREHDLPVALVSKAVRPFRDARDRAPASAVIFAGLFVFFAVLIGASQ